MVCHCLSSARIQCPWDQVPEKSPPSPSLRDVRCCGHLESMDVTPTLPWGAEDIEGEATRVPQGMTASLGRAGHGDLEARPAWGPGRAIHRASVLIGPLVQAAESDPRGVPLPTASDHQAQERGAGKHSSPVFVRRKQWDASLRSHTLPAACRGIPALGFLLSFYVPISGLSPPPLGEVIAPWGPRHPIACPHCHTLDKRFLQVCTAGIRMSCLPQGLQ